MKTSKAADKPTTFPGFQHRQQIISELQKFL